MLVARGGTLLASAHNAVEATGDPTAHAEMAVLRAGAAAAGGWRLRGATLYVTLEPCAMCAGAAFLARLDRVVYGARNALAGADGSWVGVLPRGVGDEGGNAGCGHDGAPAALAPPPPRPHSSHPDLAVTRGVLEAECGGAVRDFFRRRRVEAKEAARAAAVGAGP